MPTSRESQEEPDHPPPEILGHHDHHDIHQTDCGPGPPGRSEPPASWADRGDVDAPAWTRALPPGAWVLRAAFRASPGLPAVPEEAAGR